MAAAVPPVVFARTLNEVQAGGILDLSTKQGANVFKAAAKSLYDETEDKFDLKAEDFPKFIQLLAERAEQCGWVTDNEDGILNVPTTPPQNAAALVIAPRFNMTTQYARVTVADMSSYASLFVNTQSRAAQDDGALYACIHDSLTSSAQIRLRQKRDEYTVGSIKSGVAYLRAVIRASYVDTRALIAVLQTKLNEQPLREYMKEVQYHVPTFVSHVNILTDQLVAHEYVDNTLLTKLFNVYRYGVPNPEFNAWIKRKHEQWEDQEINLTVESLNSKAEWKFGQIDAAEAWESLTEEQKQIQSLKVELGNMKKEVVKALKKKKAEREKEGKSDDKTPPKPDWLRNNERPKKDELTRWKRYNNKRYYFCCEENGGKCQGKWGLHRPSNCSYKPKPAKEGSNDSKKEKKRSKKGSNEKNKDSKRVKLAMEAELKKGAQKDEYGEDWDSDAMSE